MRSEAAYQAKLIKKLQVIFPSGFILKNDPTEYQGIPDILILVGPRWAMLELKLSSTSEIQPNQAHYVEMFNSMSFASFICPENEAEVLFALQQSLGADRKTCVS